MSVLDIDLSQLVDARDERAYRILGIDHYEAPRKALLQMARQGKVPHKPVGNQIVFYLPQLKAHMAKKQEKGTKSRVESVTTTARDSARNR